MPYRHFSSFPFFHPLDPEVTSSFQATTLKQFQSQTRNSKNQRMAFSNSYAIHKDSETKFKFFAAAWSKAMTSRIPFAISNQIENSACSCAVKQCKNPLFNLMHMLLCHQETNQFYAILWPSYKKLDSQALKNHWKTLFFFGFKASKASYKIGQGY